MTIIVGAIVLLAWIPLRQRPGLGTISNVFVVGLAADFGLAVLSTPDALPARIGLLRGRVGAQRAGRRRLHRQRFGPDRGDGLMTGLAAGPARSVRLSGPRSS